MQGPVYEACAVDALQALAILAALLFVKHLIADGPLQTRYQLANKGRFLHPGGLLHVGIHAGFTGACLLGWMVWAGLDLDTSALSLIAYLMAVEAAVHYAADYAKVRLDERFNWSVTEVGPDGTASLRIVDSAYFFAFLADQTVHSLTYVWIIFVASGALISGGELAQVCGSSIG